MTRPYVLLSAAMSLDGFLDDTGTTRLVLSNVADLDRVDEVRASVDAILVGANTIRLDNPRLLVRDPARRARRTAAGQPPQPMKVTVTRTGELDASAQFFTAGETAKLVYTSASMASRLRAGVGSLATVIGLTGRLEFKEILADLADRGIGTVLVEGGAAIHTALLAGGLVDELQLTVAPFLLGETGAARFTEPRRFPQSPAKPLRLAESRQLGDMVLLRYLVAGSATE